MKQLKQIVKASSTLQQEDECDGEGEATVKQVEQPQSLPVSSDSVEEKDKVRQELIHTLSILSIHGKDFVNACLTYGRIIITGMNENRCDCGLLMSFSPESEKYLPVSKKTIKPCTRLGGVAGGIKYLQHGMLSKLLLLLYVILTFLLTGILFKFAVDDKGLFGGNSLECFS